MIDVSGEANVHAGDEVVLFGRQGDSFIPIEEIAAACGTINYEIMCNISRRVPRRLHEERQSRRPRRIFI